MLLKDCEIVDSPEFGDYRVVCSTHSMMVANHCGTDGDSSICEVKALADGCNCCPTNYDKSTMTDQERTLVFILNELTKTANLPSRKVIEVLINKIYADASMRR